MTLKSYDTLLNEHRARGTNTGEGYLLTFQGVEGKDVYNPSGPFIYNGETYMWARVESRIAQDAVSMLFKETSKGQYKLVEGATVLPLEDPFTATIAGLHVVGGVEIEKNEYDEVISYRTIFYKGENPMDVHPFAVGPMGMKDIRLLEQEGSIVVFTRPHVPVGARFMGRIGYTHISILEELVQERLTVEFTRLFLDQFADTEWGGVNDVYDLGEGFVGVLTHVSKFDKEGKRHYAAAVFVLEPATGNHSALTMVAERGDFPMGPIKIMPENLNRPEMYDDLADVVFSSRLWTSEESLRDAPTLMLTCGLSDAACGTISIPNPFPAIIESFLTQQMTQ